MVMNAINHMRKPPLQDLAVGTYSGMVSGTKLKRDHISQVVEYDAKLLTPIVKNLSAIENFNTSTQLPHTFSLSSILSGLDTERFYTYKGSLTTPPCAEAVTWVVFSDYLPISVFQVMLIMPPPTSVVEVMLIMPLAFLSSSWTFSALEFWWVWSSESNMVPNKIPVLDRIVLVFEAQFKDKNSILVTLLSLHQVKERFIL